MNTLKYYKKPDYDLLDKTIQNLVKTIGAKLEDPYDWEVTSNENSQRNSPTVVEKVDQKKVKEKKIAKDPHKRIKEKPRNKSKAVSKAPTDYGEREKTRVENSGKTLSDAEDLDDNALDDKEVLDIIIDQCDQKNIPSSQRKPKVTSSVNFYQSKPANKSVNFAAQKQTLTDYKIRIDVSILRF